MPFRDQKNLPLPDPSPGGGVGGEHPSSHPSPSALRPPNLELALTPLTTISFLRTHLLDLIYVFNVHFEGIL